MRNIAIYLFTILIVSYITLQFVDIPRPFWIPYDSYRVTCTSPWLSLWCNPTIDISPKSIIFMWMSLLFVYILNPFLFSKKCILSFFKYVNLKYTKKEIIHIYNNIFYSTSIVFFIYLIWRIFYQEKLLHYILQEFWLGSFQNNNYEFILELFILF